MSAGNDGGQAFPGPDARCAMCDSWSTERYPGMSLRDWFAGQSLAGTLPGEKLDDSWVAKEARNAYRMADAMIAEREKGGGS